MARYSKDSFRALNISEKDLKKLWGLAFGRCSKPGCAEELIPFLNVAKETVIGEMAHVIADSKDGPRGDGKNGGEDTYENLILLCPTHHTVIDKAPKDFPVQLLLDWKSAHERGMRERLGTKKFSNLPNLCAYVQRLLIENHEVWRVFGPESSDARENPLGSSAEIWDLRKLALIIPNNEEIVRLITSHRDFFKASDYVTCVAFVEHARGFEVNAYVRRDQQTVQRFPQSFSEVISRNAHE